MARQGGTPENLKPYQPGESGNPAGRPKGSRNLGTVLREMLQEEIQVQIEVNGQQKTVKKTLQETIVRKLVQSAANKGDLKAIREIFDRVDGKAQQFVDISTGGEPLPANTGGATHEVIFVDFSKKREPKPKPKRKPKKQ